MPQKGSRLTPEQVGLIRAWIDQGLQWEEGATFAKAPVLNLSPRRPELPGDEGGHSVDRILASYFARYGVKTSRVGFWIDFLLDACISTRLACCRQ
ncbi:MAG: hypothetical protein CM1200mP29_03500 [Verrucomicrobiota bacterium]|nr:MAG: hypothetical protein CM1200mP29_03500 [Verrucomicrobiota bacterium]